MLDDGVVVIFLRLALAGAADDLADRVDFDVAAEGVRLGLDVGDTPGIALERGARAGGRGEEGIAIAQREGLARGSRNRRS